MSTEAMLREILNKIDNLDNRFDALEKKTEAIFEQTAYRIERLKAINEAR